MTAPTLRASGRVRIFVSPVRLLLVTWLALGLAPGLGEVAESAIHLATSGHLAHSDADHGDLGDRGDEHGCGTTQHLCGCCASQSLASTPRPGMAAPTGSARAGQPRCEALSTLHEPAPPFRPPIA